MKIFIALCLKGYFAQKCIYENPLHFLHAAGETTFSSPLLQRFPLLPYLLTVTATTSPIIPSPLLPPFTRSSGTLLSDLPSS
jgi:hypothetical protein